MLRMLARSTPPGGGPGDEDDAADTAVALARPLLVVVTAAIALALPGVFSLPLARPLSWLRVLRNGLAQAGATLGDGTAVHRSGMGAARGPDDVVDWMVGVGMDMGGAGVVTGVVDRRCVVGVVDRCCVGVVERRCE